MTWAYAGDSWNSGRRENRFVRKIC